MVGLENVEQLNPFGLSSGMKKRVGLARAIVYQFEYVLYDENTIGLDPIMSDVINDIIINLKKYLHVTSIVVTHDMNSAYKISDRIMMLYGGNIIFNGMPDEVRSTKNKYVKQFVEGSSQEPIHTDRTFENVYAKFDNISGVTKKAKIKIAGVDIGILRGISLEDSQAKLK